MTDQLNGMRCPITQGVLKDPVTLSSGHTFEKSEIEKWLENHNSCPLTRRTVEETSLQTNIAIKGIIKEYQADEKTASGALRKAEDKQQALEDDTGTQKKKKGKKKAH